MKFKGTKTPWKIENHVEKNTSYKWQGSFDVVNDEDSIVAQIHPYDFYNITIEEAEANAKLIKAAPDLLEVCEASYKLFEKTGIPTQIEVFELKEKLEKAIEKALK